MLKRLANLFLCLLIFGLPGTVTSQIILDQSMTIEEYVNDFLLGEGVSAFNITFTGSEEQIGTISGLEGSVFPVESGLVLSSAHCGTDPTNPFENEGITTGAVSGDSDLLTVANSVPGLIGQNFNVGSVNDVAILEFDFIPNGDTMSFKYVFGSDEYLTWVNSPFNDIFAFFLSGPGISGPYDSPAGFPDGAINIAQVPNSSPPLPITISSVNDVLNTQYYIDNPNNTDISLNGFTDTLRAVSAVTCGETYHIKIAVADGTDTALESVVVLEEGSFSSDLAIQTVLELNIGTTTNILYENCGEGTLIFTRFGDLEASSVVELAVSGTGINGVDFTNIPNEVIFAAGDSIASIQVIAIADGIPEGIEQVIVDVTNTAISACGQTVTTQFIFSIYDDPEALALDGADYAIDCGDSVLIGNTVTGGYGVYNFTWTGNGVLLPQYQENIFYVSPGITTQYILQVDDICNAGTIIDTFNVDVPVYPPLEIDIDPSIELVCFDQVIINVNSFSGGNGTYNFEWYQDTLLGTGQSLNYTAITSNQLMVVLIDGCGLTATDVMQVNVPPVPIIIEMSEDQNICRGGFTEVSAAVSGGNPPYIYQWNASLENANMLTVHPLETQVFELTITDQCFVNESNFTTVTVSEVEAMFSISKLDYYGIEVKNHTRSDNGGDVSYLWNFGDGFVSTEFETAHMYSDLSNHIISLSAISELGCRDSVGVEVEAPKPVYIPTSFSPNGDGINDLFFATGTNLEEYEITIFDRYGRELYHSVDITEKWNGRGANNEEYYTNMAVYNYIINYRPYQGERKKLMGAITVMR
ncbi:MAG: gliding motility-associated-like protein [Patiriisocius sp.]|jgi:gliding motility-associated-like protein